MVGHIQIDDAEYNQTVNYNIVSYLFKSRDQADKTIILHKSQRWWKRPLQSNCFGISMSSSVQRTSQSHTSFQFRRVITWFYSYQQTCPRLLHTSEPGAYYVLCDLLQPYIAAGGSPCTLEIAWRLSCVHSRPKKASFFARFFWKAMPPLQDHRVEAQMYGYSEWTICTLTAHITHTHTPWLTRRIYVSIARKAYCYSESFVKVTANDLPGLLYILYIYVLIVNNTLFISG